MGARQLTLIEPVEPRPWKLTDKQRQTQRAGLANARAALAAATPTEGRTTA